MMQPTPKQKSAWQQRKDNNRTQKTELIQRAKSGDQKAVIELWSNHSLKVFTDEEIQCFEASM